jgi:hypothetical protein
MTGLTIIYILIIYAVRNVFFSFLFFPPSFGFHHSMPLALCKAFVINTYFNG